MRIDYILQSLQRIYKIKTYWFVGLGVVLLFVLVAHWLTNMTLWNVVFNSAGYSFGQGSKILFYSFIKFNENFTPLSFLLLIILALLSSINVILVVYYFRNRAKTQQIRGVGASGILLGFLGVGCASCGSVVLSTVLGLSTATTVLSWLPLRGVEFSLVSILILLYSIHKVSKKICTPGI